MGNGQVIRKEEANKIVDGPARRLKNTLLYPEPSKCPMFMYNIIYFSIIVKIEIKLI